MVYLRIKENSSQAKIFLQFIKTMDFVEVIQEKDIPNEITLKAMKAAENGKVTKTKSVKDLISKLNN